jgi:cyclic pyranopterin phosphate synthase
MTEPRVYAFERIDESLDLVPLAARRALDVARMKVSLASWREAPLGLRRAITALGSAAVIDAETVRAAVEETRVPWSPVEAEDEPSPESVPPELVAVLPALAWRALEPVGRYALWKVARGKHPEEVMPRACAEIVPLSTHLSARGEARMVDVGGKPVSARRAVARGRVAMEPTTAARLRAGDVAKGDVLGVARIAGIQAAKRTSELIPLCHHIPLTRVAIDLAIEGDGVEITAAAEALDRTGVEMEALTAATVAALTIYDMLKSSDRGMRITVELEEKSGGKTGVWSRK